MCHLVPDLRVHQAQIGHPARIYGLGLLPFLANPFRTIVWTLSLLNQTSLEEENLKALKSPSITLRVSQRHPDFKRMLRWNT